MDVRSAMHPISPIYSPLTSYLQATPRVDVCCFVWPPTSTYGQYQERVQELALLRFPTRHLDDIKDEIADDESPFAAGLWHSEDFFSEAQCSNAHRGPADLATHYQGISSGDPESYGTSVLHAWSWASEATMLRSTQPSYYEQAERTRGHTDDLWQTGFLKEIEELQEKGAEVSITTVKLRHFSLIMETLDVV